MVKFAIFVAYNIQMSVCCCCCCLGLVAEMELMFLFFCFFFFVFSVPCRMPYSPWGVVDATTKNTMQSGWDFLTLRGLADFCQFSLWQNTSSPKTNTDNIDKNKIKKTPEKSETAPSLYIVYTFVHLYIDWFNQIDSFPVSLPSCWLVGILCINRQRTILLDGELCSFVSPPFFFVFLQFFY